MRKVTAQPASSTSSPLTVAELATRLGAEGSSCSSRGARAADAALPVAQLLRREGRSAPEVPVSSVESILNLRGAPVQATLSHSSPGPVGGVLPTTLSNTAFRSGSTPITISDVVPVAPVPAVPAGNAAPVTSSDQTPVALSVPAPAGVPGPAGVPAPVVPRVECSAAAPRPVRSALPAPPPPEHHSTWVAAAAAGPLPPLLPPFAASPPLAAGPKPAVGPSLSAVPPLAPSRESAFAASVTAPRPVVAAPRSEAPRSEPAPIREPGPIWEPAAGMPGPAQLLDARAVLPAGARWSHRRRTVARRPLTIGVAVAGAVMFVGSVAGSNLPTSSGQPVADPPLDAADVLGAPVGSSGKVTLGAAAPTAAPEPISVTQPELVPPSIHPPPLRERVRPLDARSVLAAAAEDAPPAPTGRSVPVAAPPAAPDDAQTTAPQVPPSAAPEEPGEQPAPGAPGDGAPGDGAPDDGAPVDGAPDEGGPGDGGPGDGGSGDDGPGDADGGSVGPEYGTRYYGSGPNSSARRSEASSSTTSTTMVADDSATPADQDDPQQGSGDEGGRHRR